MSNHVPLKVVHQVVLPIVKENVASKTGNSRLDQMLSKEVVEREKMFAVMRMTDSFVLEGHWDFDFEMLGIRMELMLNEKDHRQNSEGRMLVAGEAFVGEVGCLMESESRESAHLGRGIMVELEAGVEWNCRTTNQD